MVDQEGLEEWFQGLRDDYLRLIIFVTEQCNFRCVYCYETFRDGRIRPEVVAGIKLWIGRRMPALRGVRLSFFGGEPLLYPSVIVELMQAVWAMRKEGQVILGDVTTNGYFLDGKLARTLLLHGVKGFQITIDGMASWHNRFRSLRGGQPTFSVVVRNILALLATDFSFSLVVRFNVCDQNFQAVVRFLKRYRWLADPRIAVHFHAIFGHEVWRLCDAERCLEELRVIAREMGYRVLEPGKVCYACQANVFVVRADGRLQKCTVALDDDRNTVGLLSGDGRVSLAQSKMRAWVFAEDRRCPWRVIGGH